MATKLLTDVETTNVPATGAKILINEGIETKQTPVDNLVAANPGTGSTELENIKIKGADYKITKVKSLGGVSGEITLGDSLKINNNSIDVDTDEIQVKLEAGENISITGNVISASGGSGASIPTVVITLD